MAVLVTNSFAMWSLAWDSRNRAVERGNANPSAPTSDAIAAVIQAAASGEGFVNELADAVRIVEEVNESHMSVGHEPVIPVLPQLSAFQREQAKLESKHGRTTDKFVAAFESLTDTPFGRGTFLYQDFADVMRLRDNLMHLRIRDRESRIQLAGNDEPTITIGEPEGRIAFVKRLMQKGLTWRMENDEEIGASWFDRIQTARMANWACRSVRAIVLAVLETIPDGLQDIASTFKNDFRSRAETWMAESPVLGDG